LCIRKFSHTSTNTIYDHEGSIIRAYFVNASYSCILSCGRRYISVGLLLRKQKMSLSLKP
ncbi:MAG: hypothetical protein K2N48_08040, partial [Muribaculaceae bacterium]|nr:hypothetical protein [Muribaculaceae bacterium]